MENLRFPFLLLVFVSLCISSEANMRRQTLNSRNFFFLLIFLLIFSLFARSVYRRCFLWWLDKQFHHSLCNLIAAIQIAQIDAIYIECNTTQYLIFPPERNHCHSIPNSILLCVLTVHFFIAIEIDSRPLEWFHYTWMFLLMISNKQIFATNFRQISK